MFAPLWAPTVAQVAVYVPHRTLVRSLVSTTNGEDTYVLTFDDTTRPTGDQVSALIINGCVWVTAQAYPLHTRMEDAAAVVATLYAAAAVERGWPHDDQSLQRANDLEKRLDLLMTALIAANEKANDDDADTGDYGIDVGVLWVEDPATSL